jgi:hypothetical protein
LTTTITFITLKTTIYSPLSIKTPTLFNISNKNKNKNTHSSLIFM